MNGRSTMHDTRTRWTRTLCSIAILAAAATLGSPTESRADLSNEVMMFEYVGGSCHPRDGNATYGIFYGILHNTGEADLEVSCPLQMPMPFDVTGVTVRIYDSARTPGKICWLDTVNHDGLDATMEADFSAGHINFTGTSLAVVNNFNLADTPHIGGRVLTCTLAPGASLRTYRVSGVLEPAY